MPGSRRPEGPKALYFVGVLIVLAGGLIGQAVASWIDAPVWFSIALWLVGLASGFRVAALVNGRLFAGTPD